MIYFYQAVISVRDPQLKQDRTDKNFFFFFIQITNTNHTCIYKFRIRNIGHRVITLNFIIILKILSFTPNQLFSFVAIHLYSIKDHPTNPRSTLYVPSDKRVIIRPNINSQIIIGPR